MPESLEEWLTHIERQHAQPIALGLDRVRLVQQQLGQKKTCPVIIVGGTNGKGSVCAMLEHVLACAGYRVGLYTSPHLLNYNERVRVGGQPVSDDALCKAFARVEYARGTTPLTYFEFGTLAAWEVFSVQHMDAVILEVGLGGRLDAVNVYEPDCSVVTSVDLDHMDFLGTTREQIGYEKSGIFRAGKAAICGDPHPPATLVDHAESIGADLQLFGKDFGYLLQEVQWQYWGRAAKRSSLAHPGLRGSNQLQNASVVLATLDALREHLPVVMQDVRRGLLEVEVPGRFQVLPGRPTVVLDVAHNPQAAKALADNLGNMAFHPETWAVFGIMRDKDADAVVKAIKGRVTRWLPCTLEGSRAAKASELVKILRANGIQVDLPGFDSAEQAFAYAKEHAGEGDRILAFGSFLTVADVMRVNNRIVRDHGR